MDDLTRLKELIAAIRNKRARIVAEHILAHGSVTTEELATLYRYNHPPRAARDLRELGIPINTFKVKSRDGRTIAAYRFGDLAHLPTQLLTGRRTFPKQFKQRLIAHNGLCCAVCEAKLESRYLQIDHCVPYSVAGDLGAQEDVLQDHMLLCASCNRAKAWSCQHCTNQVTKSVEMCRSCYWASPRAYVHVAMQPIRRLDLIWSAEEVEQHDQMLRLAQESGLTLAEYIKHVLKATLP